MHSDDDYKKLANDALGVVFDSLDLFKTALTHRSYVNEHKSVKEHNERLEFLGDAVLELVVTEFLYSHYSEPEGILTNWRSSLVRTESISAAAARLGVEPYIRLSRGERRGTARARAQILANCFEAMVGAIYLDKGYEVAKEFITRVLLVTFEEILATGAWLDPKSRLQEVAQSMKGSTPQYRVLNEEGPDHEKNFTVGVFIGSDEYGQGQGPSKQAAQQGAAEKALAALLQEKEQESVDKTPASKVK